MRGKSLGAVLIALGVGIVLTLICPPWLLLLFLGLGMIAVGLLACRW
ncbi:MAG: hypothetical protein GX257_06125 [Clostridiales bacterium]|jgi:hypothetical protein|nr:hypothetical protein [Clostridiales bacterium]